MAESDDDELFSDNQIHRRWHASPTPPDSSTEDNRDGADVFGEWRVDIISEVVDSTGNVLHEVRWNDWKRPKNKSKMTWENSNATRNYNEHWTNMQRRRRLSLAGDTLEVEVPTARDIHNDSTFLRSQAYDEKLARVRREKQPNRLVEMAKLMAKHHEPLDLPRKQGIGATSDNSSRVGQKNSTASSSKSTTNSTSALKTSLQSSATFRPSSASASTSKTPTSSVVVSGSSNKAAPLVGRANPPISRPVPVAANRSSDGQNARIKSTETNKCSSTGPAYPQPHNPSSNAHTLPPSKSSIHQGEIPSTPTDKGKQRVQGEHVNHVLSLPRKRVKRSAPSDSDSSPQNRSKKNFIPSTTTNVREDTPSKETPQSLRQKLSRDWTLAAKARGGAPITFRNDVDDEAVPPIVASFRYLENSYLFAKGIDRPDSGFLTSCNCNECGPKPETCGCQADWELPNFAYTPSGLYAFNVPPNIEVIECNKLCKCSLQCVNRVSQRPRDIPIQIFKTLTRGWGVRTSVRLERGKVLGVYTGRLIRREVSRALPSELSAYCFDLDGDEIVNTGDLSQSTQGMQGKYSVDSRREGNWTRFMNHSCSPNVQIYLVVHDRPTGSGMPYIAFVTIDSIPPFTELTFDYHPEIAAQLAAARLQGKQMIKLPIPEDSKQCLCGAQDCRRFLF